MSWRVIPASGLVAAPWRNGLGTSYEIVTQPGPEGLAWQVSIAALAHDAAFSHYPGCDRVFTPIAGDPPPELAFHGGAFEPCPLLQPKPFPGDIPTQSRIPAPGRAFNAIVDRTRHRASVTVHHLVGGETLALPAAPDLVLHCLRGRLALGSATLGAGDSAVGTGGVQAEEATVVILVAITAAS